MKSLFDDDAPRDGRCKLCKRHLARSGAEGLCIHCLKGGAPPTPPQAPARPQPTNGTTPHFDGETYDPERDHVRLGSQLYLCRESQLDTVWRSLPEIHARTNYHGMETAIAARMRDLRKPKFGSYIVEARVRKGHAGLWEYRIAGKDGERWVPEDPPLAAPPAGG